MKWHRRQQEVPPRVTDVRLFGYPVSRMGHAFSMGGGDAVGGHPAVTVGGSAELSSHPADCVCICHLDRCPTCGSDNTATCEQRATES